MQKLKVPGLVLSIAMISTQLLFLPVSAQDTQPAPQTESTDEQAENDQDTNTEQVSDLPDIDNQPIQPGSGGPGRFIPSEQISQDLGVSFPVDI
ncbi:MAG: hypothetical protein Q7W55_02435 [Pseudohongiella sp.]|nr:hypothetical protein [Pseudohongiella sp.]MDP2126709.1 hypothetical protein [Pseudohongiella sp.]